MKKTASFVSSICTLSAKTDAGAVPASAEEMEDRPDIANRQGRG